MNNINYFQIASFFHQDFERMAEIIVRISSFGKIYDVKGEGFSAKIEAKEIEQICPNKRIYGKVIQTIGESPIVMGDTVQMIFLEKGDTRVKLSLDSMSPESLVKRFLREGEIVEAVKIMKKQHILLKYGVVSVFIATILFSILGGILNTWTPIFIELGFLALLFWLDRIFKKQLRQVID